MIKKYALINLTVITTLFSIFSIAGFGQEPSARSQSEAEREVRKVEREWLDAYEQWDAEAMDCIVAGEFKITFPNGTTQTKADILAQINNTPASSRPTLKFSTEDVESRVEGEKVFLSGKVNQTMERNGKTRSSQSRYVDTYIKRDGRWQVIHSVLTPVPKQ